MGCKVWKGGSYNYKGENLHAPMAKKSGKKDKFSLPQYIRFRSKYSDVQSTLCKSI
jgi:hypothetical protein